MPAFLAALLPMLGSSLSGGAGVIGSAVMGAIRGIGGLALSAVRGIAGMALGAVGGVLRFVLSIPALIGGALRGVLGLAGNIVGVVGKVASTLGGVFLGGLFAAGAGLKALTSSAMEFANGVRTLSAQSGLGIGQSAGILRGFDSVGVSGAGAMFASENPMVSRMKGQAFGVGGGYADPDFLAKFASRFQQLNSQGMAGNFMARAMARTMGVDNPEFLRAATYSPNQIRTNQAYGQQINAKLGLGPEQISRLSQEIPLGLARISTALQAMGQKVIGVALPYIEAGINRAASWLGANAQNIGGWIETAGNWIFNVGPQLLQKGFQLVTTVLAWGVDTTIKLGAYLADNLPALLGNATQWAADVLNNFGAWVATNGPKIVNGLSDFVTAVGDKFANFLDGTADFIDAIYQKTNSFQAIVGGVAGAFDLIIMATKGFVGAMRGAWAAMVAGFLGSTVAMALRAVGVKNVAGIDLNGAAPNPIAEYQKGFDSIPSTDLLGATQNFFNSSALPDAANSLRKNAKGIRTNTAGLAGNITNYGMQGVRGLVTGSFNAANFLAPPGQANKGQMLGGLIGGAAGNISAWLKENVKPTTDSLSNMANGSSSSGAAQSERRRELSVQEQIRDGILAGNRLLEQQFRNGQSGNGNQDRVAGEMLVAYGLARRNTIRGLS